MSNNTIIEEREGSDIFKYKLTKEVKEYKGVKVYRIQALKDIPSIGVKKGDLGGFVETTLYNLNQFDNSWIFDDSIACTGAFVTENSTISESCIVEERARVHKNSNIKGGHYTTFMNVSSEGIDYTRYKAVCILNEAKRNNHIISLYRNTLPSYTVRWNDEYYYIDHHSRDMDGCCVNLNAFDKITVKIHKQHLLITCNVHTGREETLKIVISKPIELK